MPWPSCASNTFISNADPSGCDRRYTPPLVIVPSTSINKTLICLARFVIPAEIFLLLLAKSFSFRALARAFLIRTIPVGRAISVVASKDHAGVPPQPRGALHPQQRWT